VRPWLWQPLKGSSIKTHGHEQNKNNDQKYAGKQNKILFESLKKKYLRKFRAEFKNFSNSRIRDPGMKKKT
jgi:hypothetical protein